MFEVLKYLDPLWYYNLNPGRDQNFYFPALSKMKEEDRKLIQTDGESNELTDSEVAFLAIKRGIMYTDASVGSVNSFSKPEPVSEQYIFIKKYFSWYWGLYYLTIRLLQLKNPVTEVRAFLKSLRVKASSIYEKTSSTIPSEIILPKDVKISIILPTLDRYEFLKGILQDLSIQTFAAAEVIIVDQSSEIQRDFYTSFNTLPLTLIFLKQKGQWSARNEAIKKSTGDFILFVDDDSRVKEDWIENHLRCLLYFNADISAGVSIPKDVPPGTDKTFFHWAEEFDSGNAMVRRKVFKHTGLFDNTFNRRRMGDTEFGLRSYLAGFKSVSNPLASRIHLEASTGGMRSWGSRHAFKPSKFFGVRPDPGVLYLYRRYFKKEHLISFILVRMFLSFIPSSFKNSPFSYIVAFTCFVLFFPWLVVQFIYLWMKTSKMSSEIPPL